MKLAIAVAAFSTLLGAAFPAAADVHVGINIGVPPPPAVVIEAPPPLVVVPGSPVYYAPQLPYNFFYYGGIYYVFNDGYWYSARSAHGPWGYVHHVPPPVLHVPVHYYHVPPGQAKKYYRGHGRGHDDWDDDHHGHGHGHGRGHGKHD
jgi:hypothetical protein